MSVYRAYALIALVGGFLWWIIPLVTVLAGRGLSLVVAVVVFTIVFPVSIIFLFSLYWIPRFYSSIRYVLEEDEIVVTQGVWWKMKSVVPYNRVTNVNVYQGPISRHYGIGRLAVQTAGFSGADNSGHRTAEADFIGIRDFEETKDAVMNLVKGMKPVAVEAEVETLGQADNEVLEELRRIRKAVESRRRRTVSRTARAQSSAH
jgi:membrane protein YdbS with pleckstrin-like domain